MEHIVIIGNGIAGITAARHIRKLSLKKITVISAESKYFFSRTALMYVYMGHMKWEHLQPYENNFWEKNNIELIHDKVERVDAKNSELHFPQGQKIKYDKLIIASGSKTNMFDWPGQDAKGVLGMVNKQDLEMLEELTPGAKHAVVIGGGLIGIELCEMLHSRHIPVTMIIREKSFWSGILPREESEMISRHINEHGINIKTETELKEIITDNNNRVIGIETKAGEKINCDIVGITTGVSPNIDFLKDSGIETDKGILITRNLQTNIENIYAIGDCAQQREAIGERKPVEAVWYTGRMMGETVALTICEKEMNYNPGPWFNSAKFLDIEYMTYGWVWPQPKQNETHAYWEHKHGKKALRFAYATDNKKFLGINCFGIRMLHPFFDKALREEWTIDKVIEKLPEANFDPEFYQKYERQVRESFNA